MSSKVAYHPGPDYTHLIGSSVRLTLESEQSVVGVIQEQVQSSVRGDNLLVALQEPITSPSGAVYSKVLIATRASSLLAPHKPISVYVSVPTRDDPSVFTPATNALVIII